MFRRTALLFPLLAPFVAVAQPPVLKGSDAFGDWKTDKPGVRRLITVQDLPAPSKSTTATTQVAPAPQGGKPLVPDGFAVEVFAHEGLENPRAMRVAPNGDVFVADSKSNRVLVYRADGKQHDVFASGLHQPYGIAFYPVGANPEWVYVGNSDSVVRFPYKAGELRAAGKAETIVPRLPSSHHWTRDLAFSPDNQRLFIAVGSGSNAAEAMFPEPHSAQLPKPHKVDGLQQWIPDEPLGAAWDSEELRADVLTVDPQGRDMKVYATGLRNCAGLAMQPNTMTPWCVVNERDMLGDNTPFEYATHVEEGRFYGWPWYYIGGHEDGRQQSKRPDLKDKVTVGDVLIQAHSAPLGIAFYTADAFPGEWRGGAFVTLHGSWNRAQRTGYKVVYLPFRDGKATGEYVDFMTGFVTQDGMAWGRPVGVAVMKDGSLLVSDDGSKTLWKVRVSSPASQSRQ